ncbi:thiamine pyrophosphate protein TPP binding domain protein [Beutenbergia cavernae DSM 12333]|uniref:Thiamine pyrophosphate protein TPP binding domain protein n=1 Tax=Beutenbergia cavernae (strain ATCC BAA-8 / DSM 12333 / CCUG 43141 / JCM 11478 / NBRC 16432 / NCIMB 13614 / HKI 0122) TaxID=471853 RepID=C5BWH3_BEUC1|nr:pyruvate dehydrogenase [Beutenbergia cavernae]ACQ78631.1 thiamine pyrophosphate protein TPP binding domain protein [Beutenbergia cavernae DSM 12333]
MARTVAEQLVENIVAAGVTRVYGIVGDSLNPIVDAIRRTKGIDWVHVRHEEVAAFAAAGEAEVTGALAVCAGSCGPGNLHLINGLYDANRSRVPVLAIASHIPSNQIGTGFFQETHPDRLFIECSVYSEMISSGTQAPRVISSAIHHALAGPGVAVLTIPGDVAEEEVPTSATPIVCRPVPPSVVPDQADVQTLADAINRAQKVTFFVGAGARGAHDEIIALADAAAAPVGHSLRGKEVIQYDNPFDVGMSGLLGYGSCFEAMHDADLLVLIGTDFPYDQFLPDDVPTAQIDINPANLGRRTRLDYAVVGDARETAAALLPLVTRKKKRAFLDKMLAKQDKLMSSVVGAYTRKVERTTPIHPEYAAVQLDEVAGPDAVFTVDTGMTNVWAARYITPNGRRRVIGSFIHGSMANAMPHAIGAAFADPTRQVIAMAGDGGLSMLLGDLITIRTYHLPVKVVVFNNSTLGMVKLEMLVEGLPAWATDSPPVDYAAVATALGIPAVRVEHPKDLRKALTGALHRRGPALVDMVTDPNALSIPPSITAKQVKGFATAMTKEVLGGGLGEVMAMARSNLRNIPRP